VSAKQARKMRGEMKRVLARLDERWLAAASRELSQRLCKLLDEDIPRDIEHILAWVSYFPGEVDLSHFLTAQLDKRAVYLPRCSDDRSMSFVSIGKDWLNAMESGLHGIPEPLLQSGKLFNPQQHARQTAVIVPGLAFDRGGNRVGRGGGYYDRFLAKAGMRPALKIGGCWSLQIVEHIPSQSHDIIMDWVCHERASIRTGIDFDDSYDEE
jgi:5-formyltetrahydrofolate cyclo-ligase